MGRLSVAVTLPLPPFGYGYFAIFSSSTKADAKSSRLKVTGGYQEFWLEYSPPCSRMGLAELLKVFLRASKLGRVDDSFGNEFSERVLCPFERLNLFLTSVNGWPMVDSSAS
jgi:hypothetical protein